MKGKTWKETVLSQQEKHQTELREDASDILEIGGGGKTGGDGKPKNHAPSHSHTHTHTHTRVRVHACVRAQMHTHTSNSPNTNKQQVQGTVTPVCLECSIVNVLKN